MVEVEQDTHSTQKIRPKQQKTMKAWVMPKVKEMVLEEKEIPEPKDNECLIKIKHVGICGSDLHYYEHGKIGPFIVEKPIILGHEVAGEIVKAGKIAKEKYGLKEKDLVTMEPGYTCGACEHCKGGRYNLCPEIVFMATPPYDGALVEFVTYPADMIFKLPDGMSTLEGALIEPLSVGFQAANQANATIGQSAVILGSGCIGLVTLMALKARGVTEIYMSDIVQSRLDMAKKLGAHTLKANDVDVVEQVLKHTNGRGVDLVFETAGSKYTTQQTVQLARSGGTIVMVGLAPEHSIPFDFALLITREITIKTVFRYAHCYPKAIEAVRAGIIDLKQIVTHHFNFEETKHAFDYCGAHRSEVVKGVIEF